MVDDDAGLKAKKAKKAKKATKPEPSAPPAARDTEDELTWTPRSEIVKRAFARSQEKRS